MAYPSALRLLGRVAAANGLLGMVCACSVIVSTDGLQGNGIDTLTDAAAQDSAAQDGRPPIDATYTDTAQDVLPDGSSPPDAAGDAARDATPDTGVVYPCGNDSNGVPAAPLGEYATWQGKVNVHRSFGGVWSVDSDCSSGANINTITYCRKFWSTTAQQLTVSTSPELKPFTSGGGTAPTCGGVAPLGINPVVTQFACCPTVR